MISHHLLSEIQNGRVVLFLGAGASLSAKNAAGEQPPDGSKLAKLLSDRFLGGEYSDSPLQQVAEYCLSESNLFDVQDYIATIFTTFMPSKAHLMIPRFSWRALVTTNYDLLIERAYQAAPGLQVPVPFIENGDRVDEKLRDPKSIMLLKVHGCLTRTRNEKCPLILSTDQYIRYKDGRNRIFRHLLEVAAERSVVFIGHSLTDSDIRTTLDTLTNEVPSRPRYYLVAPNIGTIAVKALEAKKIEAISATFEEFMDELCSKINSPFAQMVASVPKNIPSIYDQIPIHYDKLSMFARAFLENDVECVGSVKATEKADATKFYRGFDLGWAPIEQDLDVARAETVEILTDSILPVQSGLSTGPSLVVIRGHAGSGKTILLRRIAWDATNNLGCFCLFVRDSSPLDNDAIQELLDLLGVPLFLFIDRAALRVREIASLHKSIRTNKQKLHIVTAERVNEWNAYCASISPLVSAQYELKYLRDSEIRKLLKLLEQHRALGALAGLTEEERFRSLQEWAGRQLLVALHEATLGEPFEQIVVDEYERITPLQAQLIYKTICTLNRLNVPVRAGVISRLHEVPFEEFKKHFLAPLEQVVYAAYNARIRDYEYVARHSHIAQIVFERILPTQELRFGMYITCLNGLNIDYESDRRAFRMMIRGRYVAELFPNDELAQVIYTNAQKVAGSDAYLLQQMAIYELTIRDVQKAIEYVERALALEPENPSILHTQFEIIIARSGAARHDLERDALLAEAKKTAVRLMEKRGDDPYSYDAKIKVLILQLQNMLERHGDSIDPLQMDSVVREIEDSLGKAMQRYPDNSYIRKAEYDLAKTLRDDERAFAALEKAFAINPRSSHTAIRLSAFYAEKDRIEDAEKTLKRSLDANPHDPRVNFAYVKLLLDHAAIGDNPSEFSERRLYYLTRSFTSGDKNYLAQMLYGRELFLKEASAGWRKVFEGLKFAEVSFEEKCAIHYPLERIEAGTIASWESSFGFIARDGSGETVYAHISQLDASVVEHLRRGVRVRFRIGFTLRGPQAFGVSLER